MQNLLSEPKGRPLREAEGRPRVLLVGPALKGGGAENRCRLAAEHLFGGNTGVAVFKGDGLVDFPGRERSVDLGWRGTLSYPAMIARLRRHLRGHRFDAVMAFGFYPNLVAWAAVQGLHNRPALILSEINSMWREYQEARGTARGPVLHWLRKRMFPAADLFAANSEDGLKDAVTHYGVARDRARRIPNLVEPERLARLAALPVSDALDEGGLSICIVGRLFHRKRVDTLLRAAGGLDRSLPWRIDIVGEGEDRSKLEHLAGELDIADRAKFHGWQKNPYPFIGRAAISVLCSEFEGFPNTVLEAMALGSPVVTALNTSDAQDMVNKGAALGFAVGDHLALREHLARLLSDAALRQQLSQKAVDYASRHVLPGAIREYEALVLDAIEWHRAGR